MIRGFPLTTTPSWGIFGGIPRPEKQDTPTMPLTDRAIVNLSLDPHRVEC